MTTTDLRPAPSVGPGTNERLPADSTPDEPPGGSGGGDGRPRWRRATALAAPSVFALLPFAVIVVVASAHLDRAGISRGDYAYIELSTRAALHGDVVLGPYSRYGWNHPGPALFYWFAPFFGLLGRHPESMGVGAAVLNGLAVAGAVLAARLASGTRAAWTMVAASALMVAVWGYSWIDRIWNPFIVLTLIVFSTFLAAGVLAGRRWMFAALVAVASFSVQSHVGTAPVIGLFLVAAAIGVVLSVRRDRRPWFGPVLATVAVILVGWSLPVYEQATGHPGNLTQLIDFFRGSGGDHTLREVLDVVTVQLTLGKVGMISNVVSVRRPLPEATPWRLTELIVLLVLVGLGVLLNRRAERRFEQHLCAMALLGVVGVVMGSLRVHGALERYLTLPATAIGAVLWAAVLLTVVAEVDHRLPESGLVHVRWIALIAAVAVGVCTTVWIAGDRPETHLQVPVQVDTRVQGVIDDIRTALPPGVHDVLMIPGPGALSVAGTVANQLEYGGIHTRSAPKLDYLFGRSRHATGCERAAVQINGRFERFDPTRGLRIGTIAEATIQVQRLDPPARCR